jgi:hypothetical protein
MPWDQLPDESDVAFAAFDHYLKTDRHERSMSKTARDIGKARSQIGEWSSRHRWVSRVQAHDADVEARAMLGLVDRQVEARGRHSDYARLLMMRVGQHLQPGGPDLSPVDLRNLGGALEAAARVEGRALQFSDSIQILPGTGVPGMGLSEGDLSDPEIREARLVAIAKEIERRMKLARKKEPKVIEATVEKADPAPRTRERPDAEVIELRPEPDDQSS